VPSSRFIVLSVMVAGDADDDDRERAGRLTLVTAGDNPFVASEVVWVDADLTSSTQARSAPIIGVAQLRAAELPMQTDRLAWFQ
jgi:hypothetical protein